MNLVHSMIINSVLEHKIQSQIHMHKNLLRVKGILEAYQARYLLVLKNKERA